ncbi:protein SHQ1 homolog [Dendrobium catenatum]|uniref:protein SHQ1 homolog n=1 Tax=Dendrobium catenatum TaxID=906689 RepID=UPI00109F5911|nr:protein SHQ1 homolog [Dendrobium catenatum]
MKAAVEDGKEIELIRKKRLQEVKMVNEEQVGDLKNDLKEEEVKEEIEDEDGDADEALEGDDVDEDDEEEEEDSDVEEVPAPRVGSAPVYTVDSDDDDEEEEEEEENGGDGDDGDGDGDDDDEEEDDGASASLSACIVELPSVESQFMSVKLALSTIRVRRACVVDRLHSSSFYSSSSSLFHRPSSSVELPSASVVASLRRHKLFPRTISFSRAQSHFLVAYFIRETLDELTSRAVGC